METWYEQVYELFKIEIKFQINNRCKNDSVKWKWEPNLKSMLRDHHI